MRWPQKKGKLSREEREKILKIAHYNLFAVRASNVWIDLLTDSGTGRMSAAQWEALERGDESYAGSESAIRLKRVIRKTFGMPYVRLVHQGRAGENIFNQAMTNPGDLVLGNTPFDTTRLNIEGQGGTIIDCAEHRSLAPLAKWQTQNGFLGNVNTKKLEGEILRARARSKKIAYILITATCNSTGGQAVSIANIRKTARIAHTADVPLILDLARYAENAWIIKEQEPGWHGRSIAEIIHAMTMPADGILFSGKKDALGNMGGFIALTQKRIAHKVLQEMAERTVVTEALDGIERFEVMSEQTFMKKLYSETLTEQEEDAVNFVAGYGGMSGRDMEALAQGIEESLNESYLKERISQVRHLAKKIFDLSIPILPIGGHAVFIDAGKMFPKIRWDQFPGHALSIALYREGGVRSVEIGSLMLGRDPTSGRNRRAPQELTRLAIPRRLYSNRDLDHVATTLARINMKKNDVLPIAIDEEARARHFHSTFLIEDF